MTKPTSFVAVQSPPQPKLGELITFISEWPPNVKNPRIEIFAYQDGEQVYGEALSADQKAQQDLTGMPGVILGGGSSQWLTNGGPAECMARLFWFDQVKGQQTYEPLAFTTFHADG